MRSRRGRSPLDPEKVISFLPRCDVDRRKKGGFDPRFGRNIGDYASAFDRKSSQQDTGFRQDLQIDAGDIQSVSLMHTGTKNTHGPPLRRITAFARVVRPGGRDQVAPVHLYASAISLRCTGCHLGFSASTMFALA
jgi:hypothetical protein